MIFLLIMFIVLGVSWISSVFEGCKDNSLVRVFDVFFFGDMFYLVIKWDEY